MSGLLIELILVLTLVALVSWFVGRFLCKSGEYEERKAKELIIKENNSLKKELKQQEDKLLKYEEDRNKALERIAFLEQQKEGIESKVMTLTKERDELLPYVQNLDTCKKRFTTLNEDYALQSRHLQNEKALTIEQKDEIAALQKQQSDLEQQLEKISLQFESKVSELNNEKQTIQQQLDEINKAHQILQDKYAALFKESETYNGQILLLKQEVEELIVERNEYLGRLRAISSVVDVVGTEQSNDS